MRSLNLLLDNKKIDKKNIIQKYTKKKFLNLFFLTTDINKKNKKKLKRKKLVLSPVKKINGDIVEKKYSIFKGNSLYII
jgi:hypothetical protein